MSFTILGWIGTRIYQEAPPIADKVVTGTGKVVIDTGEIEAGQNVWQSMGGMEVGSIWGHGSYVAPDWTADYLHREATFILDRWANQSFGYDYERLKCGTASATQRSIDSAHADEFVRSGNKSHHDRSAPG